MSHTARVTRSLFGIATGLAVGVVCTQFALGGPKLVFNSPATPAKPQQPDTVQITQADTSVSSQTGALSFSYPIAVPPGKLAPTLALSYSSQAPIYGQIATGWSLNTPEIRLDTRLGRAFDYTTAPDYLPTPPNERQYISTMSGSQRLIRTDEFGATWSYRAQYDSSYLRYELMPPGSDPAWQARTPDDTVHQFGGTANISPAGPPDRWPLTRIVDRFGNTVNYFWEGGEDYTLVRIEYTTNAGAGVDEPHAAVELSYAPLEYCPNSDVPIGATVDYSTGTRTIYGARKLTEIRTKAHRDAGGLRSVRRFDLGYDETEAASCTGKHGAQRHLTSIQETAWSPATSWNPSIETTLPPTRFEYGPVDPLPWKTPAPAFAMPKPTPDAPDEAVAWGARPISTWAWPTVRSLLLDLDGDGLLDRLYSPPPPASGPPAQCTFQWDRGTPTGFVPTGETVNLPTIPWNSSRGGVGVGGSSGAIPAPPIDWYNQFAYQEPGEGCSLSGQRVAIKTRVNPVCDPWWDLHPVGSYLAYRFLDIDADGLPDLVSALHYDRRHVNSYDAGLYGRIGLPAPACEPSAPGACPDVKADCLDAAYICPAFSGCYIDYQILRDCIEGSGREECSIIYKDGGDGVGDEGEGVELTGTDVCWLEGGAGFGCPPGPVTMPDPDGDDQTPPGDPCRAIQLGRDPLSACGDYVWYWYRNEGDGQFAVDPQVVLSPVPLENDSGMSGTGAGTFNVTSSTHGVRDLNGDGFLDVFTLDARTEYGLDDGWWYVWFGDGTGAFHGPDPDDRTTPYVWNAPPYALPQKTAVGASTGDGDAGPFGVRHVLEMRGLYDVNGDGLPDLVDASHPPDRQLMVYYNDGLGFQPAFDWDSDTALSAPDRPGWLSLSQAYVSPLKVSNLFADPATRRQVTAPLDRDGDGRLDWFSPLQALVAAFYVPTWLMNAGGRLVEASPMTADEWATIPDFVTVNGQIWKVDQQLVDVTGDGRADVPYFLGGAGRIKTEEFAGKPPRLLNRVDNGRGLVTDIRYASTTDSSTVTQDPATGKATPNPIWVVSSVTKNDAFGRSPTATTTYQYQNPARTRDWLGRMDFRGFEQAKYVGPSGAITVEEYDYEVDETGRLFETTAYANAAAFGDALSGDAGEAASLPDSVSRTYWQRLPILDGTAEVILDAAASTWHCTVGQPKAKCLTDGLQVSSVPEWTGLPLGSPSPVLYASTATRTLTGPLSFIDDRPDMASYVFLQDDRESTTAYAFDYDSSKYNLRVTDTQLRGIAPSLSYGRTQIVYDASGRVPLQTKAEQRPGVWATTVRTFDMATGNVTTIQKPQQVETGSSAVTTYGYDVTKTYVETATNELGHTVSTDYDYGTGTPLSVRGPNSKGGVLEEARATIDGFGRPLESHVSIDDGAGGYAIETIQRTEYINADPTVGEPSMVVSESLIDYGGSDWKWEESRTDGFGRPITTRVDTFGLGFAVSELYYDAAGNLVRMDTPNPTGDSTPTTYTFAFDSFGRQTGAHRPDGNGTTTSYGPEPLKVTVSDDIPGAASDPGEPVGTTVQWSDVLGRLVQVDEQLDDGTYATTTYEYDGRDRLTHTLDSDGYITDLEYDFANRTKVVRGAREWSYAYDLNGNVVTQTYPHLDAEPASAHTVSTVYDALDRPTSQIAGTRGLSTTEINETQADLTTHFAYDAGVNGIGRLNWVSHDKLTPKCYGRVGSFGFCSIKWAPRWKASYEYDAQGRTTEETRFFDLNSAGFPFQDERTATSSYNALGEVTSTTYADGATPVDSTRVDVTYDRRGMADTVDLSRPGMPVTSLATFSYRVAGNRWYQNSGDYRRQWVHDENGRLTRDSGWSMSTGTYSHDEGYWWYGAGDLRLHAAWRPPVNNYFAYQYDSQHQLTSVATSNTLGYRASFTYTPGGRLDTAATSAASTSPIAFPRDVTYDYAGHSDPEAPDALLNNDGTGAYTAYQYSEAGGMTSRTYYPHCGTSLCLPATTTYAYDGYDRLRIARKPPGTGSELHYYGPDGSRWLALERNGAGNPVRLRFWFGATEIHYSAAGLEDQTIARVNVGSPVARVENRTDLELIAANGLGHVMAAMNESGGIEAQYVYGPFGEILWQTGDVDDHLRRFNGKDYDETSGLYYYGYRFYDPQALVWNRADPLYRFVPDLAGAEPRRMNLYTFSLNNPLLYWDQDGLNGRRRQAAEVEVRRGNANRRTAAETRENVESQRETIQTRQNVRREIREQRWREEVETVREAETPEPRSTSPPEDAQSSYPTDAPAYSVVFRAELEYEKDYPGKSRPVHFQSATKILAETVRDNPEFGVTLEREFPGLLKALRPGQRGAYSRRKPHADLTWHHNASEPGMMELVVSSQHRARGWMQQLFHPNGRGGHASWGRSGPTTVRQHYTVSTDYNPPGGVWPAD